MQGPLRLNGKGDRAVEAENRGKLDLIACKSFPADQQLVYIVDFLNKTLKSKGLIFGVSKTREKEDEMTIHIYEI